MTEDLPKDATDGADADASEIARIAGSIDFDDPSLSSTYGAEAMSAVAEFADALLSRVQLKDAGEAGEELSKLLGRLNSVDVSAMDEKPGFLASLPIIGKVFDKTRALLDSYRSVLHEIDAIRGNLEEAQLKLLKDVGVMDGLYEHNLGFYRSLSAYLKAGEEQLAKARAGRLRELEEQAKTDADALAAQQARDYAESLNRFERRLHDLSLSRTIALQSAPQIRMIQNNDRILAEKIQTSILAAIPIWKNQMVLALSLNSQKGAAALQQSVSETTDRLLSRNAQMLHDATVATAREAERPLVSTSTLKEAQQKLISTVRETMEIANEGRQSRAQATAELAEMGQELRQALLDLKQGRVPESQS